MGCWDRYLLSIPAVTLKAVHRVGVIADDLTGANDTGVQFSKYGLSTMVVFDVDHVYELADDVDIVVIETDSRWCDPKAAYSRVKVAAEALKKAGISTPYKKIDSTLRGNIGAELDAVMDVFGAKVAFVVPAFPEMGRITLNGKQLLKSLSPYGEEPDSDSVYPATESHLPTLLTEQISGQVGHIDIDIVASGHKDLLDAIQSRISAGDRVIVVDAFEKAHLQTIAKSIAALEIPTVIAGSAGLAGELPQAFKMVPCDSGTIAEKRRHGVLVIGGSANPATKKQMEFAEASIDLNVVAIDPDAIIQGLDKDEIETQSITHRVCSNLAKGWDVAVFVGSPARLDRRCTHDSCRDNAEDSRRIVSYLGVLAERVLSSCKTAGLLLTGGDTARAVCNRLGGIGVTLFEEIAPGIPLGRLVGGPHDGLTIVTKAGGFGGDDAIARTIEYLHRCDVSRC